MHQPRAILFDVFGTLVDWRSSIIAGLERFGALRGLTADWADITDSWRRAYRPAMDRVRRGAIPWTILDDLHRDALIEIARRHNLPPLTDADCTQLVQLWHQLDPWPDSSAGLARLKTKFIIGPLSNGHLALQINLAKRNHFPWDVTFGSDLFQHYKPDPTVYLAACDLLSLQPNQIMLAAAHNDDLAAAASLGLQTAFITRPTEFGPTPTHHATPNGNWTLITTSTTDLATQLGT